MVGILLVPEYLQEMLGHLHSLSFIVSVGYHLLLAFLNAKSFAFIRSMDVQSLKSKQNINKYGANLSLCNNINEVGVTIR